MDIFYTLCGVELYSALLNDKQKELLEMYLIDNLALSEIAQKKFSTRQAIFKVINNSITKLEKLEENLRIYSKISVLRKKVELCQNVLINSTNYLLQKNYIEVKSSLDDSKKILQQIKEVF